MTGTNLQGTNIISMIVPTNHADTYATHDSFYGKGGWREVNTLAERDAIPQERRRQGMVVFVKETFKAYILKNSIYNGGWVPFPATEDVSDIINEAIFEGKIEIDLTAYATKAEVYEKFEKYYESAKVDSLLEEFDSKIKEWVEDKNYLTEHQSLENYVTKTSLGETLLSYVLKTELEQELENYVKTEDLESALEPYAKTEYVEETYATKDEVNTKLEDYSTTVEIDEKYATKDEVIEATDEISATVTDLGGRLDAIEADYITEAKLTEKGYINSENAKELISSYGYVDNEALEEKLLPYATTDAVNTALSSYATKESLEQAINNSGYLTVKDLQGYATELWVEHYIIREGLLKVSDLKGYATELWVKDYCTNYNFVTKEELQGYATEKWVEELVESITGQEIDLTSYQKKEDVTLQTESKNVVGAINELKDKIENVDLSDYAKKDELDLKADKDELALKADKEELNSRVEKELEGTHPGDVAKIQNQTDGGVMQYVSADKSNSAITVNDGSQNVGAEICSLDPDGKGSRIIANKTGAYYAVGNIIDVAPEKEIATKGDLKYQEIKTDNGTAILFNEKDGGGVKFVRNDGVESFVGVNDGIEIPGLAAQIYADKQNGSGKWEGAKIDVTNEGIYYTVGDKSFTDRAIKDNEIAVRSDLKDFVTKSTVQEIVDETISSGGEIELSSYQKKQDELLDTEDKTIVGAINEINAKNKEMEELKKQIETLTTQISTLQTQVSEMTNVIKGPQYLILGEDEQ